MLAGGIRGEVSAQGLLLQIEMRGGAGPRFLARAAHFAAAAPGIQRDQPALPVRRLGRERSDGEKG